MNNTGIHYNAKLREWIEISTSLRDIAVKTTLILNF